ncbi:hypothetical protein CERZMDRAFT_102299 [Cercospora zeae-maydis SCOH1-5]|uniref:Uncharacterized protein n=1 Tax=Cercospora zeae-maydis SCOH1-5 TaxID=717836 RepID=A0A6A6EZH0_9PEZI|nr:hypothetical protein CERZMDRAFT_102299 [Cercospora zeae-maydis SCOH1-5]
MEPNVLTAQPTVGVYTKTVVQSSTIQFILHARIRHPRLNDVVFVGDTFIHVKHVGPGGHLQHVAFKSDFDARIRHAAVFHHESDDEDQDFLIKLEKSTCPPDAAASPPQSIVLTLDSNDVAFMFLSLDEAGRYRFMQRVLPMPTFDRMLYQPGQHLAIDVHSRALAVAAQEGEIIIYAAKSREQIQREIKSGVVDWCPVLSQRRLHVPGVIQHIDFLVPPADDVEHVVLLVIVLERGLMKAVRIDWYRSAGPAQAHVHPGQALESANTVPTLLIPLQDAAFLLVVGGQFTLWRNMLSGSITGTPLPSVDEMALYPGNSGMLPVWTSWVKPRRSQAARSLLDVIYLVREDGLLLYVTIPKTTSHGISQSIAGSFDCHVGAAFASLGDEGDPDVLCVAGDTSGGKIVSIGSWPSARRIEERSRTDTMSMQLIELIPNWASVTDTITSDALSSRSRVKEMDNMFVTSGRQPHGAITELRQGFEASALAFLPLEELQTVSDVWVVPDLATGSLIIVLSSPLETMLLKLDAEFDSPEDVSESSAFDLKQRTIAAAMVNDDTLVQVTPKSICASRGLYPNFEDTSKLVLGAEDEILAACAVSAHAKLVASVRHANEYELAVYHISADEDCNIKRGSRSAVSTEPLCVAAVAVGDATIVFASTANGEIALFRFRDDSGEVISLKTELPSSGEQNVLCDHVSLLQNEGAILAVCGLRDGTLVSYVVRPDADDPCEHMQTITLGSSTVRLAPLPSNASSAIAMTGTSTLLLSWDARRNTLGIENIWITDKSQPELAQGAVTAVAQMPHANYLSSDAVAEKLLVISGQELIVLQLGHQVATVPRQVSTTGTPNRLVYAESVRHLVSSGLHYDVRMNPSRAQASSENRRQLWPVIDFIPVRGTKPAYTHHMQPGEKINAMIPWSFKKGGDKTYSYILVGGSYRRKNGTRAGKVTFLQPKFQSWEIIGVAETRHVKFDQEVTALAWYDDTTYIICAGNKVHLSKLDIVEMKWEQFCNPFVLASAGIYVTVESAGAGLKEIVITTAADSVVVCVMTDPGDGSSELRSICTGPRADYLLSHLWLPSLDDATEPRTPMVLTGSKYGQLIGMSIPNAHEIRSSEHNHRSALLLFEAHLPRSLTRLRPAPPTARKGQRPPGLGSGRVLGSATDGAVVSIAVLDESTWRKLFWLQRLIEWSDVLSPFSHTSPAYTAGEDGMLGQNRAVPIGLGSEVADMMLLTTNSRLDDMHVDGDVLNRVLDEGGVGEVRSLMQMLAEEKVNVGSWMAEHLEEELAALDGIVELVRSIDAWL